MNEETTNMRVKISTRDFAKLLAPAIGMNMQEVTDFCLKEIAKRDAPWLISRGVDKNAEKE